MKIIEFREKNSKITEPISSAYTDYINKGRYGPPREELANKLSQLGWRRAGSGAFSDVFQNPAKSYVLKVNRDPDPAYQKFVNLAKKFPNKHFAKISDQKVITYQKEKFYIYAIEKLFKANNVIFLVLLADRVIFYWKKISKNRTLKSLDFDQAQQDYLKSHPSFYKALLILGKADPTGRFLDIHAGNIMQRKDGTVVIIDPYA